MDQTDKLERAIFRIKQNTKSMTRGRKIVKLSWQIKF